ncbi:MAG: hypothetical protein V4598_05165 [Bdellovibrionota bacterium]
MKTFLLVALVTLSNPVQTLMDNCQESLEGRGNWSWSMIRVRAILEMGIKVPVLASFSINPEVELYFIKK